MALPKTEKCSKCREQATHRVFWADHRAYQPACDRCRGRVERELRAKDHEPGSVTVSKIAMTLDPCLAGFCDELTKVAISEGTIDRVVESWGKAHPGQMIRRVGKVKRRYNELTGRPGQSPLSASMYRYISRNIGEKAPVPRWATVGEPTLEEAKAALSQITGPRHVLEIP